MCGIDDNLSPTAWDRHAPTAHVMSLCEPPRAIITLVGFVGEKVVVIQLLYIARIGVQEPTLQDLLRQHACRI